MTPENSKARLRWELIILSAICVPLLITIIVLAVVTLNKDSETASPKEVSGEVVLSADYILRKKEAPIPPLTIDCEDFKAFCKKALALQIEFSKSEGVSTLIGCDTILLKGTINNREIELRGDCNASSHQALPFFQEEIPKYFPDWPGNRLLERIKR